MDPISIGVLSASIIAGLGAASWTGLKAWNGWLELKRFELTHDAADKTLPARRVSGGGVLDYSLRSPLYVASVEREPRYDVVGTRRAASAAAAAMATSGLRRARMLRSAKPGRKLMHPLLNLRE